MSYWMIHRLKWDLKKNIMSICSMEKNKFVTLEVQEWFGIVRTSLSWHIIEDIPPKQ